MIRKAMGTPFATVARTLTNADILALPTTPIVLIHPPGVGRIIQIITATAYLDNRAGAYTTDPASALVLNYTDGRAATSVYPWITPMDTGGLWLFVLGPSCGIGTGDFNLTVLGQYYDVSLLENKGISIQDNFNDTFPDYTGGNAANSMTITVYYTLEQIR